jgi:CubicO group peptidase (beta-lactamase class C family)
VLLVSGTLPRAQAQDSWPKTIDEFTAAVQKVLNDTGVPGAGIALVRANGVEWAGGVGLADRDAKIPVTADTHFRAGSISKTFVAIAITQLYEDDELDLDTPVSELVPEVRIDNAWEPSDPVRVIHLLQHTAGFDDMHFNEIFNRTGPPDLALEEVLRVNPASRVVRWRPGTRMSYSNPGYAILGLILEKVTGEKYEDRIAEQIFEPTGMTSSSFYLTDEDQQHLAKSYRGRTGPPIPYSQIYLRPAGNLHTSAADMGKFVHLMLNWGETAEDLVIDPEYLSNMEHPRTTAAFDAGLRTGYGSAFVSYFVEGFPMLGHNGGIDGFSSFFGYSTTRDVGYVVLLNARPAGAAMQRIQALAVRYLKADVEPPPKPTADVAEPTLRLYEGYYHEASPRNQAFAFMTWLMSGRTIAVDGKRLRDAPVFGDAAPLIPVSDNLFRLEADPEPTRVFTRADGDMVLAGGLYYAERRPRWQVELVRWPVLISSVLLLTPLLMVVPWIVHARRAEPHGFWWLKTWLLLASLGVAVAAAAYATIEAPMLGTRNAWTAAIFLGTLAVPAAGILSFLFTLDAWRSDAGRWLRSYALVVSIAALIVSGYLSSWGMIGFRSRAF